MVTEQHLLVPGWHQLSIGRHLVGGFSSNTPVPACARPTPYVGPGTEIATCNLRIVDHLHLPGARLQLEIPVSKVDCPFVGICLSRAWPPGQGVGEVVQARLPKAREDTHPGVYACVL